MKTCKYKCNHVAYTDMASLQWTETGAPGLPGLHAAPSVAITGRGRVTTRPPKTAEATASATTWTEATVQEACAEVSNQLKLGVIYFIGPQVQHTNYHLSRRLLLQVSHSEVRFLPFFSNLRCKKRYWFWQLNEICCFPFIFILE